MKHEARIAAVFLLCAGCRTLPPSTAHDLVGEWRFTYVQKARTMFGMSPNPPAFDIVEFKENGVVRLADSMRRREFVGSYTLDKGALRWEFSPPDLEQPVVHHLDCLWTEHGRALVLRLAPGEPDADMETEWVYYRPSRLLTPKQIYGKWVTSIDGETDDMIFAKDGTYWMCGKKIWGYYRLWPSRYGPALTTPIWIQGEGAFMLFSLYKVDSDTLTLTPLTWNGSDRLKPVEWHRATEKKTPNQ